jgi:hypothetical protein
VYPPSYRFGVANSKTGRYALRRSSTLTNVMAKVEFSRRLGSRVARASSLLALSALVGLIGCASIGPPEAPSLELPKPPTDLKAARKGDQVTLTWTIPSRTTERQTVRYLGTTRVCRSADPLLAACGNPVAQIAPPASFATQKVHDQKLTASFKSSISAVPTDRKQTSPFATETYAVEVLNEDGRSAGLSNQVRVPLAETLLPPKDFAVHLTGDGVSLTWTGPLLSLPSPQTVRYGYLVFRRTDGGKRETLVGEKDAGQATDISLTDQTFEWEKTYYYHAESFTALAQPGKPEIRIDGDDTQEEKVFAHDVFPPAVPTGLQAVSSGPGQPPFIDLIWSPVADADLAGYNVYRHEQGAAPVKRNAQLIRTPAFRDAAAAAGKKYFYAVSGVDERGNESERSAEASESIP